MIPFLADLTQTAEAGTMEISAVAALVIAIVSALGGGAVSKIWTVRTDKGHQFEASIAPQYVQKTDFEKEVARLDGDIKVLAKIQREGETNAHKRMDKIERKLAGACMGINMLLVNFKLPPINPSLLNDHDDES